jgi:hypothetical protein
MQNIEIRLHQGLAAFFDLWLRFSQVQNADRQLQGVRCAEGTRIDFRSPQSFPFHQPYCSVNKKSQWSRDIITSTLLNHDFIKTFINNNHNPLAITN